VKQASITFPNPPENYCALGLPAWKLLRIRFGASGRGSRRPRQCSGSSGSIWQCM